MKIDNPYQTVPLPKGEVFQGAFPTIEWFEYIPIVWKDKVILDLGSNQFSYGIQALNREAHSVVGIEIDNKRIEQARYFIEQWGYQDKTEIINQKIEDITIPIHDISIFSMIIHHLEDPEVNIKKIVDKTQEYSIFIFRLPNEKEKGYRPTVKQLSRLLGQSTPFFIRDLSFNDNQQIMMVIYEC